MRKDKITLKIKKSTETRQILLQSGSLLALSMFGEIFAGLFLSAMREELLLFPGLIVLYPAISDLRGDLGTSLGARLSVGLRERRSIPRLILNNAASVLILSFLMSAFIGFITEISCMFLGLPSIGLVNLTIISLVSAVIASAFMTFFTVIVTLASFYHGVDPENIVAPSLATIGDVVTVISIFFATRLTADCFNLCLLLVEATLLVFCVLFVVSELSTRRNPRNIFMPAREMPSRIVFESAPSIILSAVIGVISGTTLHMNMEALSLTPTLIALIPLIVANAGIVGSVLGARISTSMHLNIIESWTVIKNAAALFILGSTSSFLISLLVYSSLSISAIAVIDLATLLFIVLRVCLMTSATMITITTALTLISFRCGLDPSNIVIPIITSLGDIIGVLFLLGTASLYGFI